ncbi:MAG: biotin/lipoyl-containing protein [Acetobacter sp.]
MRNNRTVTDRVAQLRDITAGMRQAGVALLDYDDGQTRLLLRLAPAGSAENAVLAPATQPAQALKETQEPVFSPDMGVFHTRHPSSGENGVAVGATVSKGQIMAFVDVGRIVLPVVAPVDGHVVTVRAVEGQVIGFHDVVFEMEPA